MAAHRLSAHGLSFEWPDGTTQFEDLNFNLNTKKVGLVGDNGVGKTTFLRLMLGELEPSRGEVFREGRLGYLPQMHSSDTKLSGGQWVRANLKRLFDEQPDLLVLDEPSNDLDEETRGWLCDEINAWSSSALIISHDPQILRCVDEVWELTRNGFRVYGGNYDFYFDAREAEQKALQHKLETLEGQAKKAQRSQQQENEKLEKRLSHGKKAAIKKNVDRKVRKGFAEMAENTTARQKNARMARVDDANEKFKAERAAIIEQLNLKFDFPEVQIPSGRTLLKGEDVNLSYDDMRCLWQRPIHFQLDGAKRVWLKGSNGSGKSTLLKSIIDPQRFLRKGQISNLPCAYLDQNLSLIGADETLYEQARAQISNILESELRIKLARAGFPNRAAFKRGRELSGGERARFAVFLCLIRDPTPQFLMLDEPTNNLDLSAREELIESLNQYGGGLLVVSHDPDFINRLNIEDVWSLSEEGMEKSQVRSQHFKEDPKHRGRLR